MIFGRHSVLKRGCSIWDKQAMPEAEFQSRLDAVRSEMMQQDLAALVIYGDNYSFADLCYLTNYFPKVRGGVAIVPRSGPISLLLNIGSRDVPFARSLTWVADVRASGQLGRDGAKLLEEKKLSQTKIGWIDSGRGFPLPELEELQGSLPQVEWKSCHSMLERMRLQKSERELNALGGAGRLLNEIGERAGDFIKPGRTEHEIIADIDRVARDQGVEDIRILAGEKRLQPPSFKMTASVGNHWAVYLAIQHDRYWVETGRTYVLSGNAKLQSAYEKAREIVGQMATQLRPGASVAAIDGVARQELGELYATASSYGLGNGIGLNLWEPPFLSDDDARQMAFTGGSLVQPDMTLALRVVFETEGKLVIFGDTYQVTPTGPKCLIGKQSRTASQPTHN
jgi:Xaa-Pro aminopeptidase